MKLVLLLFCAACAVLPASAQPAPTPIPARSYSGQFTARELGNHPLPSPSLRTAPVTMAGGAGFLVTAPPVLTPGSVDKISWVPARLIITCERLKELCLREIGLPDQWRGKIELIINPKLADDREPNLTGIHRPDGWSYQLEIPKTIRSETLTRAVIQALLEEIVNRGGNGQSAEIPFWLVEGMSAHLQAFNLPTFLVRPNVQTAGYQDLKIAGLDPVRAGLRDHAPLTFQQLSWPAQSNVTGKDEPLYRCCAQLLFENLLRLDDGQPCLQRMLQEMSKHLNWQTAFLTGFHSHFGQLLDVEKWWGLSCVTFTQADLTAPRTARECWQKLQNALDVPVEVHLDPTRLPSAARLTLQEVITQWKAPEASNALQRTVRDLRELQYFTMRCDMNIDPADRALPAQRNASELQAAQWQLGKELNPLVSSYLVVLLAYEKGSQHEIPIVTMGKRAPAPHVSIKEETVRQLNMLDEKREAMRARYSAVFRAAQILSQQAPSSPVPR